ncbi:MAG: PorT family protein [Chitinophagaceae bacterium]|nr:MAG: PorT family protein [Chitinophagaceae bacterium]
MKKIMFPVMVLLMGGITLLTVNTADAQVSYGVKLGPDFSSMTSKVGGSKETTKMIAGFAGGVYANLPIAPQFYIQPSLMYEGKGGKDKSTDVKTRLNYLTLPIDFLFKPEMPNGSGSWIVGIGPYFGYGLSGKISSVSRDPFKDYGGGASLKRFDAGANVQLGYEMANGFNIALNTELGLVNILNNGATSGGSGNTAHNTSFGVTLGYTLGKR